MPKVIEVIESEMRRGEGKTAEDPVRMVTQYHTLAGKFLAERDDWLLQKLMETPQNKPNRRLDP